MPDQSDQSDRPWYAEFFGEDYLRLYRPYLTPQRTEAEVIGLIRRLALPAGSRILDLCCGHGRHSIPLAVLGYRITGLDLNPLLLAHARSVDRDVEAGVRWVQGDMRHLPFESEFDAIINVFTAFGYLESEAEDRQVLREVARTLVPGGTFLLDVVNREALVRHFLPAEIERHEQGLLVLQEQELDLRTSRLAVHITLLEPDGRRKEYRQSIRVYTLTELAGMLAGAGLTLDQYYGDLDGSPLNLDSRRLVLLARKAHA
jgi:SAM-dependent methyltransferase